MFAYLKGTIQAKEMSQSGPDRVVLDVNGIGYELSVARRTLVTVAQEGDTTTIHTALSIRENDWTIFGFSTIEERELFFLMQSVTGIGPKLALSLVGNFEPKMLAQAIIDQDQKLITQTPGVGAKVAQRIILELKSKAEDWYQKRFASQPASAPRTGIAEEVRSILSGLGYTPTEIEIALKETKDAGVSEDVETMIRYSLRLLGASVT